MVRKEISWATAAKLGTFTGFLGFIIFLLVEVAWAQAMTDTILKYSDTGMINLIIISGFLLSIVISVIAAVLSSDVVFKKYALYAAMFAFIVNFWLWLMVAYYYIGKYYPGVIDNLTITEKIIGLPRILSYYSIYCLENVTQLWAYSQFTFAILYSIFLKLLGTKQRSKFQFKYNYYNY